MSCENASSVENDKSTGDQIIVALDKYKADHGSYPDVLWALEPDYFRHITQLEYGQHRWEYIHYCKDDSFGLSMWGRQTTSNGYTYRSAKKQW